MYRIGMGSDSLIGCWGSDMIFMIIEQPDKLLCMWMGLGEDDNMSDHFRAC
jgi:hypothetical protein